MQCGEKWPIIFVASPKSLQITILAERYMPAQMQETKWFYLQTWYLSFLLHGQDFQIPNWIAKVNENTKNFHFFQSNNKNCDKSESQKMLKKISEQGSRRVVTWMFHVLQFYWKHPTKVKSPTNATNAFIHQFFLVNWRNIWRGSTLERREKNATSVILRPLGQNLWGTIWRYTAGKSPSNATSVTLGLVGQEL